VRGEASAQPRRRKGREAGGKGFFIGATERRNSEFSGDLGKKGGEEELKDLGLEGKKLERLYAAKMRPARTQSTQEKWVGLSPKKKKKKVLAPRRRKGPRPWRPFITSERREMVLKKRGVSENQYNSYRRREATKELRGN